MKTSFTAIALFKESDVCACSCCEFRQYVVRYAGVLLESDGGPGWNVQVESGIEDCIWITTGSDGRERRRIAGSPNNPPPLSPGETKLWGPYCVGGRSPPALPPGVDFERNYEYDSNCGFYFIDKPGFRGVIPNGVGFALAYAFIGVIYDTCRDWLIMEMEGLEFGVWSGRISSGELVNEKLE